MKKRHFLIAGSLLALFWISSIILTKLSAPSQAEKLDAMSYRQRNLYLLTQYAPYSDYAAYMEGYTYQETSYPSYLYREIEQSELCAIVRVKDSEVYNGRWTQMVAVYQRFFGHMSDPEGKELTQKEIKRLLAEKPYFIQYASEAWKKTVEVEQYLYDRTGRYEEELLVKIAHEPGSAAVHLGGIIDNFRVADGTKMLVFLTVPKKGEEAFGMGSCSQIITPEGYLVPVNVTRDQEAAIYGGKKLEEYTDLVMRYYEEEEKEGFRLSEKWEVYREKGRALEELYTYAPEKLLEEADETEKMGYYTFLES